MLELTSLAVGFALPHTRSRIVSPRSSTIVADASVISDLLALSGGAVRALERANLALSRASAFSKGLSDEPTPLNTECAPAFSLSTSSSVETAESNNDEWPMLGGVNKPRPKRPSREIWTPPPGWTPPTKSVQSWYDRGVRLTTPDTSWLDADVRLETPPAATPRTDPVQSSYVKLPPPVHSWFDAGVRLMPLPPSPTPLAIDQLVISERLGQGQQSEVLLCELPDGGGPAALKIGLKAGAVAREAAVLSTMSGVPGFPTMLHHEPDCARCPGGALVVEVLGPSLEDLWRSPSRRPHMHLSGQTLLRVGRGVLRLLRQLHLKGFVHNDIKPGNVLLGARSTFQPASLHLIDFGTCTKVEGHAGGDALDQVQDVSALGPIGSALFGAVAADDPGVRMRPADDVESLAFTLAFLAAGSLPWEGQSDSLANSMKLKLLTSRRAAAELTDGLQCTTAAAALEALFAEVRRCNDDGREDLPGANVDYEACLAALGGGSLEAEGAEADAISEFSFMAALSGGSSEFEAAAAEELTGKAVPTMLARKGFAGDTGTPMPFAMQSVEPR